MATFSPTILFRSVDLPAFGRPTIAATPDFLPALDESISFNSSLLARSRSFESFGRGRVTLERSQPDAIDALAVRINHFKLEALHRQLLTYFGHVTQFVHEQSSNGREVIGLHVSLVEQFDFLDLGSAVHQV